MRASKPDFISGASGVAKVGLLIGVTGTVSNGREAGVAVGRKNFENILAIVLKYHACGSYATKYVAVE